MAATEIYTLSLHDALPISALTMSRFGFLRACDTCEPYRVSVSRVQSELDNHIQSGRDRRPFGAHLHLTRIRSEEHTSELQSRRDLVCRLLLEKKKKKVDLQCFAQSDISVQFLLTEPPVHVNLRAAHVLTLAAHPPLTFTSHPLLCTCRI